MAKDLQFTFKRPCLEISGEIGSLAELIGYMQEESASLTLAFGDDMELVVQRLGGVTGEPNKSETQDAPAAEKPKRTYTRKAAPEVVAPDPLPVPPVPSLEAPLAPPLPTPNATPLPANQLAPNENGVPAFLDATNRAPPLPTPPPVGVLGPKMVAVLDEKAKSAVDGGQALADWLAQCGLTIKGKTFPEACRAVLMISDEKLGPAADILGVS